MTFQQVGEVAHVSIIERWQWYQAAVKDPSKIGTPDLPIHANEYHLGYFRTRFKNGPWEPVGIFPDESGVDVGYRGGKLVDDIQELFLWSCRNPIEYDTYMKALDGGGFDDEPPLPPIDHNRRAVDPLDALRIEYLGEKEMAEDFLKKPVQTKADADKAAIWSKRLADIAKRATDLHKVEKQPSLDEGRRVDEKWRELKDDPKALATRLKRHIDDWLREEDRKERERQRLAQEESDRLRREAEAAAQAAKHVDVLEDDDTLAARQAEIDRLNEQAAIAAREAEARTAAAGRTGAKVTLRTFVSAEITDFDALLAALKGRDEIKELVQSLANRAAKAGVELPGMKIVEERRAV